MDSGWIKLHRKSLHNPVVMKNAEHLAVWVLLLLLATHDDYTVIFKNQEITLKPGQLITGRKILADKLSIDESKVRRILDFFRRNGLINVISSSKSSLITLVQWERYQALQYGKNSCFILDEISSNSQQKTNKPPASDQQATNNQPTSDQQATTNNNINNKKTNKYNNKISKDTADVLALMINRGDFDEC